VYFSATRCLPCKPSFLRSTTKATTGIASIIIHRMAFSGMCCKTVVPSQLPGRAAKAAGKAIFQMIWPPFIKLREAARVPMQADSLLVPAANTGGSPAR